MTLRNAIIIALLLAASILLLIGCGEPRDALHGYQDLPNDDYSYCDGTTRVYRSYQAISAVPNDPRCQ